MVAPYGVGCSLRLACLVGQLRRGVACEQQISVRAFHIRQRLQTPFRPVASILKPIQAGALSPAFKKANRPKVLSCRPWSVPGALRYCSSHASTYATTLSSFQERFLDPGCYADAPYHFVALGYALTLLSFHFRQFPRQHGFGPRRSS